MAETNASALYISSPQTIAEMHPLSVSIVKLDGTLFGTKVTSHEHTSYKWSTLS